MYARNTGTAAYVRQEYRGCCGGALKYRGPDKVRQEYRGCCLGKPCRAQEYRGCCGGKSVIQGLLWRYARDTLAAVEVRHEYRGCCGDKPRIEGLQ
jgi:hypothetical protein